MEYNYEKMWNTLKKQVKEELNNSSNYKDLILYMNIDNLITNIESKEFMEYHKNTLDDSKEFLDRLKKEKEERDNNLYL